MAKKKMDNDQLKLIFERELEASMGRAGGDLSEQRRLAYEYYMRKPFGNEEQGLSSVVSSDVAEVVDSVMPSLLRMFTMQDNLLTFDPVGLEDEPAAEQQSDYISYVFFKRNPAFQIMFYWFFDALVQINGYVKAYWDDAEKRTVETYENLSDDDLLDLLQDDELEPIERDTRTEKVDTDVGPVEDVRHDVKFHRVRKRGQIKVESVPPEEVRVSKDCATLDLCDAKSVFHVRMVSRGELLEMGFDKKLVDSLPAEADVRKEGEEVARRDRSDEQNNPGSASEWFDRANDDIELAEGYLKVDMDSDGKAELKQVFMAGGKILEVSDADRQPFHTLVSSPLPHKHYGEAYAEKVMSHQLVTSTLLRQILDNLYHTNNPGHALWEAGIGDTTMSDLLTRRIGAVTTFARPVNESYQTMAVPFTAGESFPMLEWFDRQKRNRTGVQANSEGLEPERLKHIQRSVMMTAYDQNKEKIELVARLFAETGFKSLFLHMHELTLKHKQPGEVVKLRGEYVPINPSEWKTRYDMTVNIGLGIGTRESNLLYLESLFEKQAAIIQGGGGNVLVKAENVYNTLAEMVKNMNYKQPEMFFTKPPPDAQIPQPSDEQLQLQKQQQELQQRQQQLDAERQQVKQAELQLKAQKQEIDAQLKMMELKEKANDREDKYAAENEKLRNELFELQLETQQKIEDRAMEQEKQSAEIEKLRADAARLRAEVAKIMGEVEAQSIENAATESGVLSLVEAGGESDTD